MSKLKWWRIDQGTGNAGKVLRVNAAGTEVEYSDLGAGTGSYIPTTEKGAANGVAPLDSTTKIPATYLPGIAITTPFVVASEAAMLALTAQEGDVAIRSDLTKNFILKTGGNPAVLADWLELYGGTVSGSVVSKRDFVGHIDGFLIPMAGVTKFYNDSGVTLAITAVRATLVNGPTGSAAIFDVNIDGLTIFTNQANRPTIAAGTTTHKTTAIDDPSWPDGSYCTVDTDAIGSTFEGQYLTFQIEAEPAI